MLVAQWHTASAQRDQSSSAGNYKINEKMNNECFKNPDLVRIHKGFHLSRRLQKLDKQET